MGRLEKAAKYLSDILKILRDVNTMAFALDRVYVSFLWVNRVVMEVRTLVIMIAGFAFIGHTIDTQKISWTLVIIGIIAYAVYLIGESVIVAYAEEREEVFRQKLDEHLEERRLAHVKTLDLGRLVDPEFIDLANSAEGPGERSVQAILEAQTYLLASAVGMGVSAVVMFALEPFLGLLAAVMAGPEIARRWLLEEHMRAQHENERIVRRKRSIAYSMVSDPERVVYSRMLKLVDPFIAIYRSLQAQLFANMRERVRYQAKLQLIVSLISAGCMSAFWLYFANGLVSGNYSYLEMGAIVGSLSIVASALRTFGWGVVRIEQERRDYDYLIRFFDTKPLVDDTEGTTCSFEKTPEIVVEDMTFTYPGASRAAIDGCRLTIEAGEKVAFVGPNGCGKTTLLRLIARIYGPSSGAIWADAVMLNEVRQVSWIQHLTMLPQAVSLPSMQLVRALTGSDADAIDKDRFGAALQFSRASEIVSKLKYGLDTWIGEAWPQGSGFSTGERQRLAISAALYRLLEPQVHVALFDEPTANCDAETKARFYASLTGAPEFRDKTIIVSLHDPLYLQFFDRVVHFEEGKVVKDVRGKEAIADYQKALATSLAKDL
jgi:ATP-binding cassette subfamily B protein